MENQLRKYNITYSEKEKFILFLPAKTGTVHASFIFNHFDFTTDILEQHTEEVYFRYDSVIHHHSMNVPQRYNSYSIICTARNPYTRLISAYHNSNNNSKTVGKPFVDFKEYFSKSLNEGNLFFVDNFSFRQKPHYFLRVERLYHDYIQIPFIRNSKLNKSGILYELCNKKIHVTRENRKPTWEYYTQDMADALYSEHKTYFETVGYDKDSWKQ